MRYTAVLLLLCAICFIRPAAASITCPNDPAMLAGVFFPTLQSAYNGAVNGSIIETEAVNFTENLDFGRNIAIKLLGGYDCNYSADNSYSTIAGTLTISNGTVNVSNVIIQTPGSVTTTTTTTTIPSTTTTTIVSTTTSSTTIPTSSTTTSTSIFTSTTTSVPDNIMTLTVNGSECDPTINSRYWNDPCVSVKVCTPGSSTCQTINGILLDTGSYGLRIFKSVLGNVTPAQIASGSGSLAECVTYGDNTATWGPVQTADVVLGGESVVQVPVQVIEYTFVSSRIADSVCPGSNQNKSPSDAGFNGILGVGPLVQDCGSTCISDVVGLYYSCSGSSCRGTTVPLTDQVSNPVASLPADNNGLIVQLPVVPEAGAESVNGSIIFGIGTQPNNSPSDVSNTYTLDAVAEFTTIFNGSTYSDVPVGSQTGSFIDTGSNALYFPTSNLVLVCPDGSGFYCPQTTISNPYGITSLFAEIIGSSGSPSNNVSFQIGNFTSLTSSLGNMVFDDIGGNIGGISGFDWGLPFYFGKNVFIGFEGMSSSLGTGPYFAY